MSTNKFEGLKKKLKITSRWSLKFLAGKDSFRVIMKSTFLMSLGTLASRVLGFFRDIILARILGTGITADAFYMAFKIPNLFRCLVGEGATNAAVVPVFAEYLEKRNRATFWNFVSVVLAMAVMILTAITILGMIFAPAIVKLVVPGFAQDPVKLKMTIDLTRMLFPYLIFIGLVAYGMGILFTFRLFLVPAFSPCLLNVAIIIAALWSSRYMREPVYGIAAGVLAGGVLQLAWYIWPLRAIGLRFKWPRAWMHPGVIKIGKLLVPRMIGSGIYQLTVLVDSFCASLAHIVGQGGISAIYYADRIVQFPLGIFGVALASAILPSFAGLAGRQDMATFKKTLVYSLENIFFLMFPAMVGLMLFAHPIIRILFERGAFDAYSTSITASALLFYALGLFSFGGIKVLVSAFHALQDTKTPVKVAFYCLLINAFLNFILMHPLQIGGIALATSIAGTIDFVVLFFIMRKRLGGFDSDILIYGCKVVFVSVMMGVVLLGLWMMMGSWPDAVKLVGVTGSGIVIYEVGAFAFGIKQAKQIWKLLFRTK